jgi:hypothetical protein
MDLLEGYEAESTPCLSSSFWFCSQSLAFSCLTPVSASISPRCFFPMGIHMAFLQGHYSLDLGTTENQHYLILINCICKDLVSK